MQGSSEFFQNPADKIAKPQYDVIFFFFFLFLDTLRVLLDWIFIRSSRGTSDERFVVLMAVDEETFYVYNWYNMWGARQHGKIPLSLRNRQTLCSGGPLGRECLGCFWKKLKIKGGCLGERMLDVSFSEKIKNHGGGPFEDVFSCGESVVKFTNVFFLVCWKGFKIWEGKRGLGRETGMWEFGWE